MGKINIIEKLLIRFLEFNSDKYYFLKYLPVNAKILDIGCGDCRRIKYRLCFRNDLIHYGIDLRKYESCSNFLTVFKKLDITQNFLPFGKEEFDAVILSHIIEHLPASAFINLLIEIRRVLKKGGYIYIEFPSEKTKTYIGAKTLRKFGLPVTTFNFYDDKTHIICYSVNDIVNILLKNRFEILKYGHIKEYIKKILSPMLLFIGILKRDKNIVTGTLWAIVNWAAFVIGRK